MGKRLLEHSMVATNVSRPQSNQEYMVSTAKEVFQKQNRVQNSYYWAFLWIRNQIYSGTSMDVLPEVGVQMSFMIHKAKLSES